MPSFSSTTKSVWEMNFIAAQRKKNASAISLTYFGLYVTGSTVIPEYCRIFAQDNMCNCSQDNGHL